MGIVPSVEWGVFFAAVLKSLLAMAGYGYQFWCFRSWRVVDGCADLAYCYRRFIYPMG